MAIEGTRVRLKYSETREEFVQVSRLYRDDGLLLLDTDPDEWILSADPADCRSVLILELVGWRVKKIDCVSMLNNLQRLLLPDCSKLEKLPENLGDLGSLTHLSLYNCPSIEDLPSSIGKLSNLTALKIYHCQSLEELPANLGDLGSLTDLSLKYCCYIKWLPSSIGKLFNLTALKICHCQSLEELPANLGDLGSLTHLSIEWCRSIKWLPHSIGKLSNLTALKIYYCESLEELPATLGDLGSLNDLCIEECDNIKSLPNSIGKLFNLTDLRIQFCKSLKELPADLGELSNLSLLNIRDSNIKWLPRSIANLSKLSHLLLPRDFRLETLMPTQLNDSLVISVGVFRKTWGELKTEIAQFGCSHLSGRTVSSSHNHELHAENEDCVVPVDGDDYLNFNATYGYHIPNSISQVDADANGLEVSENNPHVQPVMFPSSAANPNSSLQETTLDESNVQTFQNIQMDNMENEQRTASAASENPVHDRSGDRALQHKRKKTEKIILTKETLEELMTQGITTEEAAKKLGVSRPTVVRSLKEKSMSWPRPKKLKQHEDTNMVDPANAMRRTVEEPSLETRCQVDGQQVEEHSNAANEGTSSNTVVELDGNPRTIVVKATRKKDSVRFNFSLRSSIEQLEAEVGKRLKLDVGKFKMKYMDEDNEWMLMADVTDLNHVVDLSKSVGSNVIRLSIVQ